MQEWIKGGKRLLRTHDIYPGLWPVVLERAIKMYQAVPARYASEEEANIIFSILHGPALLERWASSIFPIERKKLLFLEGPIFLWPLTKYKCSRNWWMWHRPQWWLSNSYLAIIELLSKNYRMNGQLQQRAKRMHQQEQESCWHLVSSETWLSKDQAVPIKRKQFKGQPWTPARVSFWWPLLISMTPTSHAERAQCWRNDLPDQRGFSREASSNKVEQA